MVAYQGEEVILPSSQPEYFQGEELPRTSSPFGEYNLAILARMPKKVLLGCLTGGCYNTGRAVLLSSFQSIMD